MGAGRTIGMGIAQLPMMRAQAANRAAQGQFYVAHAGQEEAAAEEARARAGLTDTQNQRGQLQLSAAMKAVGILQQPGALTRDDEGNLVLDKDAEQGILASVAGASTGGDDMSKGVGGLVTAGNAANQARLNREVKAALPKGTPPINASATATIAGNLPASALKSVEESNPIPGNPATPLATGGNKPFPLTLSQALQSKLQNTFTQLVKSGVSPAEAEIQARSLVMGTNATAAPVTVTNSPGSPAIKGFIRDTPAVPPNVSTNSFTVQPGGADQTIVSALMQNPKTAAVIQQLGLAPATANTPADNGTPAPQAGTATAKPASTPQPQHVAYLLQHPELAQQFDQKFGPGAAERILNGARQPAAANAQ
jgi:hypothetical protein